MFSSTTVYDSGMLSVKVNGDLDNISISGQGLHLVLHPTEAKEVSEKLAEAVMEIKVSKKMKEGANEKSTSKPRPNDSAQTV